MSVDGQPFHLVHKEKLQRLWTIATLPIVITEQDAARRCSVPFTLFLCTLHRRKERQKIVETGLEGQSQ